MNTLKIDNYHFSGYATKNDITCSDGRIIRKDAFAHNDGLQVPLVWRHQHDDIKNVLGHAYLENREDGVYAYGVLNDTEDARHAAALLKHGDINALSIFANKLKQEGTSVIHGMIREVSLVLKGANPGALIDNVLVHSDEGETFLADEATIYHNQKPIFGMLEDDEEDENLSHSEKTVQEVIDSFNDEQTQVLHYLIGSIIKNKNDGGKDVKHNLFAGDEMTYQGSLLSHEDVAGIFASAKKGGSLKDAFNDFIAHSEDEELKHAGDYGIDDIDILFPDAQSLVDDPDFISRDMGWVGEFLGAVHKSPFSRVKSVHANITADEARAKGYVKGNKKIEEVFPLLKRVTTPTTIYKKQKLDRDDIIDITSMNVVAFMKKEMRVMLDEEIARAVLIGDGRAVDAEDKINENNIRPVYTDDALYAPKVRVANNRATADIIEDMVRARKQYKGKGSPNFYTTTDFLIDMLLVKDAQGRRLYATEAELRAMLRCKKIIEVEVMEGVEREYTTGSLATLLGIFLRPADYNIGADKGGQVAMFDDFDIDYNQYKYLIETRISGALTKPYTALIIEQEKAAG